MRKSLICALLILSAAGGYAGWKYYSTGSFLIKQQDKGTVYVTSVGTLMKTVSGAETRFAGVVEAQETVSVQKDPDRKVSEVKVSVGDEVKKGDLLFEYDLSSIQSKLQEARLDFERLQNEGLNYSNQINAYETERLKPENANRQLDLLIDKQTAELNLKKNEYDIKSKEAEIKRLEEATENTLVTSEIDGIVQKIDTSKLGGTDDSTSVVSSLEESDTGNYGNDTKDAFITILSTGEYRVKGLVNELNRSDVSPGEGAVIRSRADETKTWHGTFGAVDTKNSKSTENNDYYSGESMTSSSSYPFYVDLETSDGLMLGQHVYIEKDIGQENVREGIWLSEDFILFMEDETPYVWASDENSRLIKKPVSLGEHDEEEYMYEITDGLTEDDFIAFPSGKFEEGMNTKPGTMDQTMEQPEFDSSEDEYESSEEVFSEESEYSDDFEYMDDPGYQDYSSDEYVDFVEGDNTDASYEYEDPENSEEAGSDEFWSDDSLDWEAGDPEGTYVIDEDGESIYVIDDGSIIDDSEEG